MYLEVIVIQTEGLAALFVVTKTKNFKTTFYNFKYKKLLLEKNNEITFVELQSQCEMIYIDQITKISLTEFRERLLGC